MGVQPEGKRSDPYERFRGEAQRFFYAHSNSKWRLMACLGLKFLVFMGLGF
jgi:hypothetical protein